MTDLSQFVVVIPAYQPNDSLVSLVRALSRHGFGTVVVVNDGSAPQCDEVFARLNDAVVLRHAVNLGKGAALKTAFNHVLINLAACAGVITADADGQHLPEDIVAVAERLASVPDALVLGTRRFSGDVPLRSRVGNVATAWAVRLLLGQKLTDTQTGLRGIPRSLLPDLLRIRAWGYEFELEMLAYARHVGRAFVEQPVSTVYEPGNPTSHFNPLLDSMRIYFVLLRFSFVSLLTAVLDNVVFSIAFGWFGSIPAAQALARGVAVLFNYTSARGAVFLSRESHSRTLPKYLALVAISGSMSYALIQMLTSRFGVPVLQAKLAAEALLFIGNFAIQRDFVFRKREERAAATDWDAYYGSVPFTARLTRRYTGSVLTSLFRRHCPPSPAVVELGGANSCFIDRIAAEVKPSEYHVVDFNQRGLDMLQARAATVPAPVVLHHQDCLRLDLKYAADVVFSVGLIEHFTPEETRRVVQAHFDLLKPGGWAIISYPTPTWLYRTARGLTEAAGMWKFPDERPLAAAEVASCAAASGDLVFEKVLWPLVFTQRVMVWRKGNA